MMIERPTYEIAVSILPLAWQLIGLRIFRTFSCTDDGQAGFGA